MSRTTPEDARVTFRGATVREALTALRAHLGEEALVLAVDREGDEFVVTASHGSQPDDVAPRPVADSANVDRLRRAGFSMAYARDVSRTGGSHDEVTQRLVQDVAVYPRRGCRDGDASGRRVFVFAGPTGVGKTTTLAKLAGRLVHDAGVEPVLITLDTYRVAAVEQLRAYADLLGLPFRVARDADALQRALDDTARHPVCLIDTAGRSPLDAARVNELAAWLHDGDQVERFLCLSATTAPALVRDIVARFSALDPDACIFTKLDENPCFGALLETAHEHGLRIAYVTDGQEVPDDLHVADARDLVTRVLAGERVFERSRMEVLA